jgi:uncharacterized protein (TIGR02757 family)
MNLKTRTELKNKLEYHYKKFDRSTLSPDPLEFPHKFSNYFDIEIAALLSSVFAYGNVSQINSSLDKIFSVTEWKPYDFVVNFSLKKQSKLFAKIKHRFYTPNDIGVLFAALNRIYQSNDSLKKFFLMYYFDRDENLKEAISFFSENVNSIFKHISDLSLGLKFMFPNPKTGSACKRMNLFLRWMVRKDTLDLGLWNEIPKSKLIIPVDTHIARICKELKLTTLNNISWKMAEEITDNLKHFDENDPVKYDFAICHIGMRKMKL